MNISNPVHETDDIGSPRIRTPTPPPPPAITRLSKSHSTVSYQFQDIAAINCLNNQALMPVLDQRYNCCSSSLYTATPQAAISVDGSQTLDKRRRKHQHQYQYQHQYHCRHHHQHNQQNQLNQQQIQQQQKHQCNQHQHQQQKQQQHTLRHHKSSPSIELYYTAQSQKSLKSPTTSSLSFIFGNGSGNSPTSSTPKSSNSGSGSRYSKWRNSFYHSFDDLDATTKNRKGCATTSAEKRVVSSLKYLCACTGATLRNLSKKTKDLHAKNYYGVSEPLWRLWGEEKEEDAIFTVYLKKVRYNRPTPTAVSADSDGEISYLAWETVRVRFVKAATLARLVEALATDDGELESTFINVFLSTYRTFSTPKEVLSLLIRRYNTLHEKYLQELEEHGYRMEETVDGRVIYEPINPTTTTVKKSSSTSSSYDPSTSSIHEQHKKTLVSALHVWLDGFPEDWNEDNLRQILAFSSKRLPRSELHMKVLHRLERIIRQQVYGSDLNAPPWLSTINGNNGGGIGGNANGRNELDMNFSSIGMGFGVSCGILSQHYNPEFNEQFASLCLSPAFRGPTHFLQAFHFPHVPVRHFAEQLTRMDSELFKRLIPHQCLGATWARRDKSGSETVVATINQFNAVLFRVISSILIEPRLKSQERALNIATWIDIAQELRLLKNFSSLKAIISGLQSNPIYRLTKTWSCLPKEKLEVFHELARIFSSENNAEAQREVLMREGTAKFADTVGENDSHLQKIIQKQSTQTSHGTIPYLGIFLTDLTMTHAAIPDTYGNTGFINFDKKRKEFEVLARIKLLQGAANTYNLRDDPNFDRWFTSMPVLDEREAHTLSCQLEAPPPAPRKSAAGGGGGGGASMMNTPSLSNAAAAMTPMISSLSGNNSLISGMNGSSSSGGGGGGHGHGHRKTDSIASNSSSGAGSQFYCELNNSFSSSHYSSRHSSLDRDAQLPHTSLMSASSSVSNLSLDSSNSGGQKSISNNSRMTHSQSANGGSVRTAATGNGNAGSPMINAQYVQTPGSKSAAPDFYIIRVTYETDKPESNGIVLYKSIMLGNNERTPQVIRNAMMKLGLEDDPDKYTLAQVLPDKELVMPKNANVYYAVNTNYNLNFILRPRKDGGKNGNTSS